MKMKCVNRGELDVGPPAATAHDEREICGQTTNKPECLHVPPEYLGVSREGDYAFLNPRPAGVCLPMIRAAVLDGDIHHLADLLREHPPIEPPKTLKSCEKRNTFRPTPWRIRCDCVAVRGALHHPRSSIAMRT